MPQCAKFDCSNMGGHRFPKDPLLKKEWEQKMGRENFVASSTSVVCKAHFRPEDYMSESYNSGLKLVRKRLKKGAVPSLKKIVINKASVMRELRREQREIKKNVNTKLLKKSKSEVLVHPENHFDFIASPHESTMEDSFCEFDIFSTLEIPSVGCEVSIGECSEHPTQDADIEKRGKVSHSTQKGKVSRKLFSKDCKTSKTYKSKGSQTVYRTAMMSFEKIADDLTFLAHFTGLENREKFMLVLHSLGPAAHELNFRYCQVNNVCVEDQLLLTLMKLRLAIPDLTLAFMFSVCKKTVQNIFVTWVRSMYLQWSQINIWPSKELIMYYMPEGFKQQYPSTRTIIDGTEIPIEASGNPLYQQACFSTYKNRPTLKGLVGMTPGGLISHVSPMYGGSASDRSLIERSDLVQKCDPSDSIMADRGFTVQDLFATHQVAVNIPAFLKGKAQISSGTLLKDRKLSSKRVHIERLIELAKTYDILEQELPAPYVPFGSEIFYVCCMLCNFRKNIVSPYA